MGKSSGGKKQTNPHHARGPNAFGPGLSDPGAVLQISAGGVPMPTGSPDFSNTSLGGQMGALDPQILQQIIAAQQKKEPPQTPNTASEGGSWNLFDLIREQQRMKQEMADQWRQKFGL